MLVDPIEISRGASTAATFTSPFLHGPSFNSCNSNQDVVLRIVLHEGLRETGRGGKTTLALQKRLEDSSAANLQNPRRLRAQLVWQVGELYA